LALGEEADFEALNCLQALNLIRSTQFKFSTNFHTKNVRPHYAKPMLAALAFLFSRQCLFQQVFADDIFQFGFVLFPYFGFVASTVLQLYRTDNSNFICDAL